MRLGKRQIDVLRLAATGKSTMWHNGQGRMAVSGKDDVYGNDVLDALLDKGLIDFVEDERMVNSKTVVLTEAGVAALAAAESR